MELSPEALRRQASGEALGFRSTSELEPLAEPLGQDRARQALAFAMGIKFDGYNLYALGVPQTGMHELVAERLRALAADREAPDDWCYLPNFDDPATPHVARLPQGVGRRLKNDVATFLENVRTLLPAAFNSEDFRQAASELAGTFQERQSSDAAALQEEAETLGLTMLPTPNGFAFAPVADGKVMDQETFNQLDEDRRKEIAEAIERMNKRLVERLREYPRFQEELIEAQRELAKDTAASVLAGLIARLKGRYQAYDAVMRFISAAEQDLLGHTERIVALSRPQGEGPAQSADQFFAQYSVNLLVDNSELTGAPVIYESNPSLDNLVGKLEHRVELGTPVTDFSMIRAGALHRANGGYLMLDVDRLLSKPFAWEALKRALADRCIRVESVSQLLSMAYSVSLDPEPVALGVKVVLLGNRYLYHALRGYDPDFDSLFKIVADFDDYVSWTPETEESYARLLARLVKESRLRPLTADAVASTLEHSSRMVTDRRRLSAHISDLRDVLQEADHIAAEADADEITERHVDEVISRRLYRLDRIREAVHENIIRGVTVVETQGARVGQVNGLSMLQIGHMTFGQPSRITATARLGRGEVIDIEREARLGGNIHRKAVLIVSNFIGARYAKQQPLSLHASLVFEQSYGGIEGDSASIAEVCALLSAITERPLRQDLAVTGSMDQHGTAQAIGGVNEKIEGFFDICKMQGFSGDQGVIIPATNVDNLMLRQDVVDAVAAGRFHVYTMASVDDAIALLFAAPGEPPADVAAIDRAVAERLAALHEIWISTKGESREDTRA